MANVSRVAFYSGSRRLKAHPVRDAKKPSLETKLDAARRCFSLRRYVQSVSRKIGFSSTRICKWKRKHIEGYKQMKSPKKKAADKNSKRELTETEKDKEEA